MTICCRNYLFAVLCWLSLFVGVDVNAIFLPYGPVRTGLVYCSSLIAIWLSEDGTSLNFLTQWPQSEKKPSRHPLNFSVESQACEYPDIIQPKVHTKSLAELDLPENFFLMHWGFIHGALSSQEPRYESPSYLYLSNGFQLYRLAYKVDCGEEGVGRVFNITKKAVLVEYDFYGLSYLQTLPDSRKIKTNQSLIGDLSTPEQYYANLVAVDSNNIYLIDDKEIVPKKEGLKPPLEKRSFITIPLMQEYGYPVGVTATNKAVIIAYQYGLQIFQGDGYDDLDVSKYSLISINRMMYDIRYGSSRGAEPQQYEFSLPPMVEDDEWLTKLGFPVINSISVSRVGGDYYVVIATSQGIIVGQKNLWGDVHMSINPHEGLIYPNVDFAHIDNRGQSLEVFYLSNDLQFQISGSHVVKCLNAPASKSLTYDWPTKESFVSCSSTMQISERSVYSINSTLPLSQWVGAQIGNLRTHTISPAKGGTLVARPLAVDTNHQWSTPSSGSSLSPYPSPSSSDEDPYKNQSVNKAKHKKRRGSVDILEPYYLRSRVSSAAIPISSLVMDSANESLLKGEHGEPTEFPNQDSVVESNCMMLVSPSYGQTPGVVPSSSCPDKFPYSESVTNEPPQPRVPVITQQPQHIQTIQGFKWVDPKGFH